MAKVPCIPCRFFRPRPQRLIKHLSGLAGFSYNEKKDDLHKLYAAHQHLHGSPRHCEQSEAIYAAVPDEWQQLLDKLIKKIWGTKGMPETLDANIVKKFADEYFNAISEGISGNDNIIFTDDPGRDFIEKLTGNVWQFSGAKNYAQQKAISEQLVDATGKLRSFKDFQFHAGQINADFVGTWLKAEYNNAVASAQMGAKWLQIQKDKEILPYLQYITAGDERVRLEHQELDDIIRSVDDDFWNYYFPPNGWNCRCDVKQLSYVKKQTDLSKRTLPDVPKLFQQNVGKTGNAFPPMHPYFENLPAKVTAQVQEIRNDFESEFVPATSLKEAEQFAIKKLGASYANYKGLDLAVANDLNKSVYDTQKLLPVFKVKGLGTAQVANKAAKDEIMAAFKESGYYQHIKTTYNVETADRLAKKYVARYIKPLGKNTMAWSTGITEIQIPQGKTLDLNKYNGVFVNPNVVPDKATGDAMVIKNQASGWFTKGVPDLTYIMHHEHGHEIDKLLRLRNDADFLVMYKRWKADGNKVVAEKLSRYGATAGGFRPHEPHEFIAESWAEFATSKNPRPLAKELGELILRKYYQDHVQGTGTTYHLWIEEINKILGR